MDCTAAPESHRLYALHCISFCSVVSAYIHAFDRLGHAGAAPVVPTFQLPSLPYTRLFPLQCILSLILARIPVLDHLQCNASFGIFDVVVFFILLSLFPGLSLLSGPCGNCQEFRSPIYALLLSFYSKNEVLHLP